MTDTIEAYSEHERREAERRDAAFRQFGYVLCLGAGTFGVLALWALVSRFGVGLLPVAIIGSVIIWFGVRAVGYGYGIFTHKSDRMTDHD